MVFLELTKVSVFLVSNTSAHVLMLCHRITKPITVHYYVKFEGQIMQFKSGYGK